MIALPECLICGACNFGKLASEIKCNWRKAISKKFIIIEKKNVNISNLKSMIFNTATVYSDHVSLSIGILYSDCIISTNNLRVYPMKKKFYDLNIYVIQM